MLMLMLMFKESHFERRRLDRLDGSLACERDLNRAKPWLCLSLSTSFIAQNESSAVVARSSFDLHIGCAVMKSICRFYYNYPVVIDNGNIRLSSVLLCYPIEQISGCIRYFRLGCTASVHCIPNRSCAAYILHDAPCPCPIVCSDLAPKREYAQDTFSGQCNRGDIQAAGLIVNGGLNCAQAQG